MKWPWGSIFNLEQRKETAKVLLGVCQTIVLAIIASPYIPAIVKKLTIWDDNIYGSIASFILYLLSMRLLKEKK